MNLYRTAAGPGRAEQTIEKSRFIASAAPVPSRMEAENFIAGIRQEFPDATHHVPAFVIGRGMELQWASDDGEPHGTSGAPILNVLVQEGLTNIVVVVTRYFGGVKLGRGGLVRAYTSSARLGLEAAGLADVRLLAVIRARTDYASFDRIRNVGLGSGARIENPEYGAEVTFDIIVDPAARDEAMKKLAALSGGRSVVVSEEERTAFVPAE